MQPGAGDVTLHKLVEARLVNGDLAGTQPLDFGDVDIHAKDFNAGLCQTGAGDQTYVTSAYNRNAHLIRPFYL
jgi:hypothetical protein